MANVTLIKQWPRAIHVTTERRAYYRDATHWLDRRARAPHVQARDIHLAPGARRDINHCTLTVH